MLLRRIEVVDAKHRTENVACGKALQRAGMKFEGTLRSRRVDKNDGHRDDLNYYSVTKEDLYLKDEELIITYS